MTDFYVLSIACPYCGAGPEMPCRSKYGVGPVLLKAHQVRRAAYFRGAPQ